MKTRNTQKNVPKLFGPREDWQHNACVNFIPDSWDLYAVGYKEAAEILVEKVIITRSQQDMLVYPIIFLYRQYLELRLKIIIRDGRILLDEREDVPGNHKLMFLWQLSRSLIERIFRDDDLNPLNLVENIIKEFEVMDPAATAFRYPVDKKGHGSLPDMKHINIAQFQEKFNEIISLLEGVTCAIAEYISYKEEMKGYIY